MTTADGGALPPLQITNKFSVCFCTRATPAPQQTAHALALVENQANTCSNPWFVKTTRAQTSIIPFAISFLKTSTHPEARLERSLTAPSSSALLLF